MLGSQASSPNGDRIVLCRGRPALRAVAILITTGLIALLLAVGSTGTNMAGSAVAFAIPISLVLTIQITGFTAKVTASGDWLEIDGFFAMERVHVSAIRFVDGEAGFRVHLWNGASVAFVGLGGSLLGAITKERYARRGAAAVLPRLTCGSIRVNGRNRHWVNPSFGSGVYGGTSLPPFCCRSQPGC